MWAHGLLSTKEISLATLRDLVGYRVLAFDQRGHGDSSRVRSGDDYTLEATAGDVRVLLDHLGWSRAIVGGESMGAATALTFARLCPDRVQGLILDRPAIGEEANHALESQANAQLIRRRGIDAWAEATLGRFPATARASIRSRFAAEWYRLDQESAASAFEGVGRWTLESFKALASLTVPTVIRAWPGDPLHPLHLAERLAETLPRALLVVVSQELLFDLAADRKSMVETLELIHRLIDGTVHPGERDRISG